VPIGRWRRRLGMEPFLLSALRVRGRRRGLCHRARSAADFVPEPRRSAAGRLRPQPRFWTPQAPAFVGTYLRKMIPFHAAVQRCRLESGRKASGWPEEIAHRWASSSMMADESMTKHPPKPTRPRNLPGFAATRLREDTTARGVLARTGWDTTAIRRASAPRARAVWSRQSRPCDRILGPIWQNNGAGDDRIRSETGRRELARAHRSRHRRNDGHGGGALTRGRAVMGGWPGLAGSRLARPARPCANKTMWRRLRRVGAARSLRSDKSAAVKARSSPGARLGQRHPD